MPAAPPCHVLVIDDYKDSADALVLLLRLEGLDAMACYSADAGWQAAQALRPRVVIAEPSTWGQGLDGLQLAQLLNEQAGDEILLLALGTSTEKQDHAKALQAGFSAYFVKAHGGMDLVELVRHWIRLPARPVVLH